MVETVSLIKVMKKKEASKNLKEALLSQKCRLRLNFSLKIHRKELPTEKVSWPMPSTLFMMIITIFWKTINIWTELNLSQLEVGITWAITSRTAIIENSPSKITNITEKINQTVLEEMAKIKEHTSLRFKGIKVLELAPLIKKLIT